MSLVWIHEDAISLDHPVVSLAGETAHPVFIWDSTEHDRRDYTLKRRLFIYECAHDLDIPIYAGDPFEILTALADGGPIYAARSADPYIRDILSDLKAEHDVKTVEGPQLAFVPEDTDTGRFFRFWNRVKKSALTPSSHLRIVGR